MNFILFEAKYENNNKNDAFFPHQQPNRNECRKKNDRLQRKSGCQKNDTEKTCDSLLIYNQAKKNHISLKNHFFLTQSIIFYLKCFQTKKNADVIFFLYFFACECQFPSEQHMAKSKRFFNIFVLHKQIVT